MTGAGLVLLDFDGTLVTFGHDVGYIRARLNELLAPLGLDLALPLGYLLEGFAQVVADYRRAGADAREAAALEARLNQKLIELEAEGATRCHLVEGAPAALAAVVAAGYKLAVVTRGHPSYVDPLLAHHNLDRLISATVTRDDQVPPKPHPAGAHLAARRAGLDPAALARLDGRYFLVGDHPMDMQMAGAAGAVGVGVLTGLGTAEDLKAAGAAHILKSVAQLPKLIE